MYSETEKVFDEFSGYFMTSVNILKASSVAIKLECRDYIMLHIFVLTTKSI